MLGMFVQKAQNAKGCKKFCCTFLTHWCNLFNLNILLSELTYLTNFESANNLAPLLACPNAFIVDVIGQIKKGY